MVLLEHTATHHPQHPKQKKQKHSTKEKERQSNSTPYSAPSTSSNVQEEPASDSSEYNASESDYSNSSSSSGSSGTNTGSSGSSSSGSYSGTDTKIIPIQRHIQILHGLFLVMIRMMRWRFLLRLFIQRHHVLYFLEVFFIEDWDSIIEFEAWGLGGLGLGYNAIYIYHNHDLYCKRCK